MAITSASLPAKKRILTVCVRLFLEKGYTNTKVAEILKEADVSAGSFQNIFHTNFFLEYKPYYYSPLI